MSVAVLVVVVLAGLILARRRRAGRQDEKAGLVSARPTFTTEPPRRSHRAVKGERL